MKRSFPLILAILAIIFTLMIPSCRGGKRLHQIRDLRKEKQTAISENGKAKENLETGETGESGEITPSEKSGESKETKEANIAFAYEKEPLDAAIEDFRLDGTEKQKLTGENYKLYKLSYESDGEKVPALFALPKNGTGPFPAVLLLHGHKSSKNQMIFRYANALTGKGVACIAIDLPLQGERKVEGREFFSGEPMVTAKTFQRAVIDSRRALDWLETREDIDKSGIGAMGYSLGSWVTVMVAHADKRIDALALNVMGKGRPAALEGSWPDSQENHPVLERLADRGDTDLGNLGFGIGVIPKWTAEISPRPIFMLNGKNDKIVTADSAQALFDAAAEPKSIKWYDSGHILPPEATEDAVNWIADSLVHVSNHSN